MDVGSSLDAAPGSSLDDRGGGGGGARSARRAQQDHPAPYFADAFDGEFASGTVDSLDEEMRRYVEE